jgi:hypothetical protein
MTAEFVAHVILDVYSNGHVKEGAKRLDYEDFLQMVYMAKGELLRLRYKEDRLQGDVYNINSLLEEHILPVKMMEDGKRVEFPGEIVDLPGGIGVYSLIPAGQYSANAFSRPLARLKAGSEWLYADESYMPSFAPYDKYAKVYNVEDCVKKMRAVLILNSEDSVVPHDLAWGICKEVWRQVFRNITLPVDKTADNNPNVDDIFKAKLSSPQTK